MKANLKMNQYKFHPYNLNSFLYNISQTWRVIGKNSRLPYICNGAFDNLA